MTGAGRTKRTRSMGNQTTPTDRWARLRAQLTFDEGSRLRVYR